jgi:predicted DNA-binding protein (MmcQ/YjbR family)
MNFELIRNYCLNKRGVTESFPFDDESPVYKVMSRIFLIAGLDTPVSINIKCDPETAVDLRERFDAVTSGYHMNKMHWNTVVLNGSIPAKLIYEWIDNSYKLVVKGLKKSEREKLEKL